MDKLEKWRGYVPDEELETYKKGGFGERIGMGERVALLNVDTTYMFVDPAYSMCGRDMTSEISHRAFLERHLSRFYVTTVLIR